MFDFGFSELMLVGVVALLVVGPERLPKLAREVGLWVGKAKRMVANVRRDIEAELKADELKSLLDKQQDEIKELKDIITDTQAEIKSVADEADDAVKSLESTVESRMVESSTDDDIDAEAHHEDPDDAQARSIAESPSVTSENDAERPTGT